MSLAQDVALLAPVPVQHLVSALELPGEVAFGSNAFQTFETLQRLVGNERVQVYIYASHPETHPDEPRLWTAEMTRTLPHDSPELPSLRPKSAKTDTPFVLYWIVSALTAQKTTEGFPMHKMRGYKAAGSDAYKAGYPQRPLLVQRVFDL